MGGADLPVMLAGNSAVVMFPLNTAADVMLAAQYKSPTLPFAIILSRW
jgi:hypothetical protein